MSIALAQFSKTTATSTVTLTGACRRRREIMPLLLEPIEPTSNIDQYNAKCLYIDLFKINDVMMKIRIETTAMAKNNEPTDRVERGIDSSRDALLDYLLQRPDDDLNLPRFCLRLLSSLLFPSSQASAVTTTTTITIPTSYLFSTTTIPKTVCTKSELTYKCWTGLIQNVFDNQVLLGSSAASGAANGGPLTCLPQGFGIC